MSKHVVATVAEIPPGSRKLVTVRGRQIAVFNLDGEFFGLFNRCPHQGGPMCEGILTGLIESDEPGHYRYSRKGEILRCPWHGWEFDVRTGQSYCEPDADRAFELPRGGGRGSARRAGALCRRNHAGDGRGAVRRGGALTRRARLRLFAAAAVMSGRGKLKATSASTIADCPRQVDGDQHVAGGESPAQPNGGQHGQQQRRADR